MTISEAQSEVRSTYIGGFVGQLVSGSLWLASCAASTWASKGAGIVVLMAGGVFIYPVTQAVLRAMARKASLPPGNPFRELSIEVAFMVPLLLPLAIASTIHRAEWFYPAAAVVVGAQYLPFAFVYGMRLFMALSGTLVAIGIGICILRT